MIDTLFSKLPAIRDTLDTDVQAAYEGDPAATCREEVMLAYPAFEAISIFRIAHELYLMKVPMLPRMMTEYAHSLTGIDIHPAPPLGRTSSLTTAPVWSSARPPSSESASSCIRA